MSSGGVQPPPVVLVAIAGGSGSGKTWLARTLQRRLREDAGLLSLDDFYRDLSHLRPAQRARTNFDSPAAIDWPAFAAALRAIRNGEEPLLPCYDFARHTRSSRPQRWRRRRLVLVEGLWPWVRPRIRALFALRIFRDASPATRFARRLHRDVRERGRTAADVRRQWDDHVEPMHQRHVEPQRDSADVLIGGTVSPARLAALVRRLRALP